MFCVLSENKKVESIYNIVEAKFPLKRISIGVLSGIQIYFFRIFFLNNFAILLIFTNKFIDWLKNIKSFRGKLKETTSWNLNFRLMRWWEGNCLRLFWEKYVTIGKQLQK
jgi:hypothetical protein